MSTTAAILAAQAVTVEIGGIPLVLRTNDLCFRQMLNERYAGFVASEATARLDFDIELVPPSPEMESDEDLSVSCTNGIWLLRRGDFRAQWDPRTGRGWVRQSANPYSIDSVLRVVHSLILAREGGLLLHAASAVRFGRAFLFAGVSGAGKTTIARLAPPDVTLLTDEISYVRHISGTFHACGTPFSGELGRPGENCSAPIAGLFLLAKGPKNCIEPVSAAEATGSLLRNILFFAQDPELVMLIFRSACSFVEQVPVRRLTFVPDQRVWSLIG